MKNIITFCFFFSFIVGLGFAQNVKPKFEIQENLTKATYFYENGKVKEIGYFKNEKLQGKWISYNKDGDITAVANYENGKKEGTWFIVSHDTVKELTYKSNKLITVKNVKSIDFSFI